MLHICQACRMHKIPWIGLAFFYFRTKVNPYNIRGILNQVHPISQTHPNCIIACRARGLNGPNLRSKASDSRSSLYLEDPGELGYARLPISPQKFLLHFCPPPSKHPDLPHSQSRVRPNVASPERLSKHADSRCCSLATERSRASDWRSYLELWSPMLKGRFGSPSKSSSHLLHPLLCFHIPST